MADKKTMAIVGLILNILILPGLGTLIGGGKTSNSVWQIVLFIIGIPLTLIGIGAILTIGAWIWALVDMIKILQAA